MKNRILWLGLILLIISGCSAKPETEEPVKEEVKKVSVLTAEAGEYIPTIEIAGTLEPFITSPVATEASGTVAQIFVTEGDRVGAGQQLLALATGDSLEGMAVDSARTSLSNTRRSLDLTRQQTLESEKQAQIGIQQATENLENIKKTDVSTGQSVDAQIAAAESGVALAKLNLENTQKSLTDLQENLRLEEQSLGENRVNTIASAVNIFTSVMQDADTILGVTDINQKKNDEFETYLGFKEPQTKIDAVNTFRLTWNNFKKLEEDYAKDPTSVTSARITTLAAEVRDTLRILDNMLQNTTTGTGLSEMGLSGFRATTTVGRSNIEGIIQGITAIDQQQNGFVTGRPQLVRGGELAVASAREQLLQAEKALQQSRSGGDVNLVGTANQIAAAENQLESARSQLNLIKKQGEIAIQSMTSAVDSAQNALESTELQLSKLSVSAPFSGIITEKKVEAGTLVTPGTPVFTIVQMNSLLLKGDVPLESLEALSVGMEAVVTIDTFGEKKGVLTTIQPIANELTRRVGIEIEIKNDDLAIPAQIFATAKLSLTPEPDVLMIPFKSLVTQNPPAVLIIGEGDNSEGQAILMAEKREIEIGRRDGDRIEVLSGLTSGETFIPEPVLGLMEGDLVEISAPSPSALPETTNENRAPAEQNPGTESNGEPSPDS